MTEKELVKYIQDKLDGAIDSIERTIEIGDNDDYEQECLYEYLIMQCSNAKRFIEVACMREWRKKDLRRIYLLAYNSILSIDLLMEHEKDSFEYCEYVDLYESLTDCMQTLNSQILIAD